MKREKFIIFYNKLNDKRLTSNKQEKSIRMDSPQRSGARNRPTN